MKEINPNTLIFRESDQSNLEGIRTAFPDAEYAPIVIISDTNTILDGHNRTRIAQERGHLIPAVEITESDYQRLQAAGYDDMEIAFAALLLDGETDAAYSIDAQFGGIVAPRGLEAYDIL